MERYKNPEATAKDRELMNIEYDQMHVYKNVPFVPRTMCYLWENRVIACTEYQLRHLRAK